MHAAARAGLHSARAGPALAPWRRAACLLALAAVALTLGLAVYRIDRSTAHAQWLGGLGAPAGMHLFGPVGLWLPSFVHVLAFSLASAALLPDRLAAGDAACAAWAGVGVLAEAAQHPRAAAALVDALQHGAVPHAIAQPLQRYLLHGRFDPGDIAAALFGALVAAMLLRLLHRRQETL